MAFVSDTFTDTAATLLQSHTGETGATWTKHPNSSTDAEIDGAGTGVVCSTNTRAMYYASGSPAGADYDVECDIIVNSDNAFYSGPFGRMSTSAYTGYHGRIDQAADLVELYKVSAGSFTSLGTPTAISVTTATYAAKLSITDATKSFQIDALTAVTSSNNDITAAGKAGFRWFNSFTATVSTLDNFVATDAAAGGGRIMGSLAGLGGLAGHGGLAGSGGGLAG